ncbi:MAG: hypothetical protein ABI047_13495 [Jatrophihabitantaceae bacterium]
MTDPYRPTGGAPAMPRWVKVFAAIVALLVLVVLLLVGSDHGPGMHTGLRSVPPPTHGALVGPVA